MLRLALHGMLGRDPDGGVTFASYPFQGLVANLPSKGRKSSNWYVVLVPAFFALMGAFVAVRRLNLATFTLTLNVLFLVVLLPASSYDYTASGRVTLGVVLAFVLCIPSFPSHLRPLPVVAIALAALLWLEPWSFWCSHAFLT